MTLVGATASGLRGKRYIHSASSLSEELAGGPAGMAGLAGVDTLTPASGDTDRLERMGIAD